MRLKEFALLGLFLTLSLPGAGSLQGQGLELTGYVALESRLFPQSPLLNQQFSGANVSFTAQPEFFFDFASGSQSLLFVPYLRADQRDGNRTHFDIRELFWLHVADNYELSVGLRKIYWGVTESQHLVDIINQTDQLDNLDAEDKLGQPMVNLTFVRNWGAVDLYLMPYFRERAFLEGEARLRAPVQINTDRPQFESDSKEWHFTWAARWFHTLGIFDIGLSHFSGTGREPLLMPRQSEAGDLALIPFYHTINQTGLDLQATTGGWLLKLEAISRHGQDNQFFATVGGFEYTFGNIKGTGLDVGVLTEYHYDERGKAATSPFDDDVFLGGRLAFNDVQSTDFLAGAVIDRDTGSAFLNIEASRRFGDRYKIEAELRSFLNASPQDPLFVLRKDHYLQFEISRYF